MDQTTLGIGTRLQHTLHGTVLLQPKEQWFIGEKSQG